MFFPEDAEEKKREEEGGTTLNRGAKFSLRVKSGGGDLKKPIVGPSCFSETRGQ